MVVWLPGRGRIFYAELKGGEWSEPEVVLRSSELGWDSVHVCGPSVVEANFGQTAKTGTTRCTTAVPLTLSA